MASGVSCKSGIIKQVIPDLYTGEKTTENGRIFYFGFEKLDEINIVFWRFYANQAYHLIYSCGSLCKSATESSYPQYPNKYSDIMCYGEAEYHSIMRYIQAKKYDRSNPFNEIKGGINGMSQMLLPSGSKNRYIVYLSTVPVMERHLCTEEKVEKGLSNQSEYNVLFGSIVMSFVFITENDNPTVSHYGIFKNPIHWLGPHEKYKRTSMALHGFAADIAITYFTDKKFMVTHPLPSMTAIFSSELEQGEMFIGTNKDLKEIEDKSDTDQELLIKYPPIWHIDYTTHITKIAKDGVDLSLYPDFLPDEHAKYIALTTKGFDCSGFTVGAMKTVVKLERLASFFRNNK